MAAPNDEKFSGWLSNRLLELDPDIDVEVFAGYITSILEDDVSNEETIEALTDFLSQVTEQDTTNISSQITQKWKETHEENQTNDAGANSTSVDDRLSAIMEKSKISVALKKETTSEDDTLKQAILQQYSQISDGEETDEYPLLQITDNIASISSSDFPWSSSWNLRTLNVESTPP
ncbi:coiled-coil domain-containing protein 43-like [Tubulanus polymorphus]|uniref:coiled-coil domain-containing protein 43-like n=1 Tax=Tubulanus polymorphus TaxID=672921 RepID=UPI003DA281A8